MAIRAGIVVTGTEVLTGRVSDRNGPWLAEQLRLAGVDIAQIVVVGDRPADLTAALESQQRAGLALILTSGGLGPTADDLTAHVVAEVQGRTEVLNPALQEQIGGIIERLSAGRGWRLDPVATQAGVDKQATVPVGASVLPPVGTAPGLVVPPSVSGAPIVVLPGPPSELQAMWPGVLSDPFVVAAIAGHSVIEQRTIRLWGTAESDLAATLREHEDALDGLEITTCLRDGELEIVTRFAPEQSAGYDAFEELIAQSFAATLFSRDGRSIDQMIADALLEGGLTIATAESCTAGLLAGRLTDLAGSSAYVRGGLVVYSNEAKRDLAGVDMAVIDAVGAVSPDVARALADGARARLESDIGVGITGIAGPGGATPGKPVGLVHLCVSAARPGGEVHRVERRVVLPGNRAYVRRRATVTALQLVRQLLDELPQPEA